jgi:hypothetical protein
VLVFDNSNLANPFRKVAEFERGQSVVVNASVPRGKHQRSASFRIAEDQQPGVRHLQADHATSKMKAPPKGAAHGESRGQRK